MWRNAEAIRNRANLKINGTVRKSSQPSGARWLIMVGYVGGQHIGQGERQAKVVNVLECLESVGKQDLDSLPGI